ncbi:MAG TPA: hypothetical protein V6C57_00460 [Coleofasciculaceae cyanobacterium]
MNRWLLGSGAIVSSAMAIYGWTHPSALNLSVLARPLDLSKPLPKEMETSYNRLLKQARLAASRDRFAEAIRTIAGIPKNSRFYGEARQLQEGWTQELLQRASSQYKQANVQMALWMINTIPPESQRYARAIELRQRWSQESALLRQATAAQSTGDWNGVMAALKSLQDSVLYQTPPAQMLLQQATAKLFGSGKMAKLAATVPANAIAQAPLIPSMAEPNPVLPSVPVSAPANLPVDRAQALRWAEPIAANPNDMLVSQQSMASHMNGIDDAPAPEFVPLEWAPRKSFPVPDGSSGDLSNMPAPNRPSAMPPPAATLYAPGRPAAPSRNPTASPASEIAPPGAMPMISSQRSPGMRVAPIGSEPMSWNGHSSEMPTATGKTSTTCKFPGCDFPQSQPLPAQ